MAIGNLRQESPAVEAWRLLFEFFESLDPYFDRLSAEMGLSSSQAHALILLDPDSPVAMSRLARHLHCDASNVTGIVDRLEEHGLAERRPDERDRRVKIVGLTTKGRRLRERALERLFAPPPAIAALPPADQRALRDIMQRVSAQTAS